jgi:release factor glutamine methyltransferase
MLIRQALQLAREQGVARLDAQLLLSHVLQQERSWLLAHDDVALDAAQAQTFGHWL